MAALRCSHCDTVLTDAEAIAGMCPACDSPIGGDFVPEALPVVPTAAPVRGRWLAFPAGLVVGAILTLSAAVAWSAWGPGFRLADAAGASTSDESTSVAAEDRARRVESAARAALEAAVEAEERRAATAEELADTEALAEVAEERVTVLRQAAADAEDRARSARAAVADAREAEDRARKARAAAERADITRAAAERALTDTAGRLAAARVQQADLDRQLIAANARLQAAKGKEEQARQAEAEAQRARQAVEKQLAESRSRLQAARAEVAALDKVLAERKAKLAERDRATETKKVDPPEADRAAAARRPRRPLPSPDAVPPEPPPPPGDSKPTGAFVREWLIVGPFADADRKGHATAFPPEAGAVDPGKEYKGAGGPVRWRPHSSPADYVDLAKLFRTQEPAVGYAVCWVRSDRARSARLSLGSNDGIKVWVNGKQVADKAVSRSAAPDQDRVPCELTPGWNELRVKVDNTGGPWGFYLELQEPTGERPPTGPEFRVTPPPDPKAKK